MLDASLSSSTPSVSREQMRLVLEVSRSLAVTTDLDILLTRIARAATGMLSCERASVFLHDVKKSELWTKVALQSEPIRVPVDSGIVGLAFRSNEVIHCPDAYADVRFNSQPDRMSGFVTRKLLAAPMVDCDSKPVGVLQAINKIAGDFTETDAALLRLLADQAGVAIQRYALQQEAILSSGLRHEMFLARRVQEAMIPRKPPTFPGLCCAGWTQSASINGGDCYDLWDCNGKLGILVADASGHGIAPALVVSQVRALVRTLCEIECDPLKLLLRIDERLAADLEPGSFVTAFLGFLSADGLLTWSSAGHGPTLLCQHSAGCRVLNANWPPLGLMRDAADAPADPIQLEPGQSLLVLSDGITEAFDPRKELFGINRVISAIEPAADSTPESVLTALRNAVFQWQGKEEPVDDQTVVVVRRETVSSPVS